MSQFFELLVFLDVNEELSQSVKNELTLINEDIDLILEEFFAVLFEILWHGGTEHHDLLVVWSLNKDFLNVSSHAGVAHDFVALVNNKEFNLNLIEWIPFQS